jgi:hypothetical protein
MLQKRQNDRLRRRLMVERLEDRMVLSSNVTASLDPATGLLSMVGDSGDNAIAITQGANGTTIVSGETETTVNGEAAAAFDNVTGISVQFLDGNDIVDIHGVVLPGAISVTAGVGNDTITLENSTFQQADVTMGAEGLGARGSYIVDISNDVVTGSHLNLSLLNQNGLSGSVGFGPGSVNAVNVNNVQFTAAGDLNLIVDDGDVTQAAASSSVMMTLINTAGNVTANLGDQFQDVHLSASFVQGNATIAAGNGDVVNVSQTVVGGSLDIGMGNGGVNALESLTLADVTSADLFINMRSNFGDTVNINLTNLAVTDTSTLFAFEMSDEGGSGGCDHVSMVDIQVEEGMVVHLSPSFEAPNVLYAANVTCAFGYISPGRVDSIFVDGGGNDGWQWYGMPV